LAMNTDTIRIAWSWSLKFVNTAGLCEGPRPGRGCGRSWSPASTP